MTSNQTANLHLVACVKKKAASPAPAALLYRSPWFKKARAYVEGVGAPWFVLSAMHGLVAPDQIIMPYEQSLYDMDAAQRRSWGKRVICQLEGLNYAPNASVVVLSGALYREPIAAWLGTRVIVPMANLPIGKQMAWLTAHTLKQETDAK